MNSIADIVGAVANPYSSWRTLKGLEIMFLNDMPEYFSGNASVIFNVRIDGKRKILKCYTRHNPRLKAIYGERYLASELLVSNIMGQQRWVDCLLTDFIEGSTLHEILCQNPSQEVLHNLASAFDRMAEDLLQKDYAHGDIKPENIIVGEDGQMTLIDWDASFLPIFEGQRALETGTAAYQHPLRTSELYDKHIDDYSIAFISTLLHAYAVEPEQAKYYAKHHQPQIHPREIYQSRLNYNRVRDILSGKEPQKDWLHKAMERFAERAMGREYHIARLLRDNTPQLFSLQRIFTPPKTLSSYDYADVEANVQHGLWGYSTAKGWVIAPYYDECNDPKYNILQVRLAGYKHLLRCNGELIATFSVTTKIKIHQSNILIKQEGSDEEFKQIIL